MSHRSIVVEGNPWKFKVLWIVGGVLKETNVATLHAARGIGKSIKGIVVEYFGHKVVENYMGGGGTINDQALQDR